MPRLAVSQNRPAVLRRGRTCSKEGPAPERPMSACGLTYAMISARSFMLGVSSLRAICFLCSGSLSPREVVIRPLESTMKIACAPQGVLQTG